MLDIPDKLKGWAVQTMPDYKMNLIDARHMGDEEISRFTGDLKAFLWMLKGNFDRGKLEEIVAKHRETWYAVSAVKNDSRYRDFIDNVSDEELEEGVNMDAALDYFIEKRGKMKERAECILEILEDYGSIHGSLESRVKGELDMNVLKKWLKLAARVSSVEEFEGEMDD